MFLSMRPSLLLQPSLYVCVYYGNMYADNMYAWETCNNTAELYLQDVPELHISFSNATCRS